MSREIKWFSMYHKHISASCVIVTFSGQSDTFTEVIVSVILVDIYYSDLEVKRLE